MAVTFDYLHNYKFGKCVLVLKCVLQISVLQPFKTILFPLAYICNKIYAS